MGDPIPRWRRPEWLVHVAFLLALSMAGLVFFRLTEGDWWLAPPSPRRWWLAMTVVALYSALCVVAWRAARGRAGRDRGANSGLDPALVGEDGHPRDSVLIAYASQTGFGEDLARRTGDLLRQAGRAVHVAAIHQLDRDRLVRGGEVLFVASTTGEGDPPDHAAGFVREVMRRPASLDSLRFGVLALGDRQYPRFCAFGRQLDQWLRRHGARPLFEMVEVDDADEAALQRWRMHMRELGRTFNRTDASELQPFDPRPNPFQAWCLDERHELNPGTAGGKAFLLALSPPSGVTPNWVAGDIAEVLPRHAPAVVSAFLRALAQDEAAPVWIGDQETTLGQVASRSQLPPVESLGGDRAPQAIAEALRPLKPRQYSIASLPDEGVLQLMVRRVELSDGTLGICSGWVCDYASLGGAVELRIRSNPNFHPPDPSHPMVLIGNGTGIAGLRSHLKARIKARAHENWVLFGERNAHCDFFFRDDLERWRDQGAISRLQLAFSRDQTQRIYVQHKLRDAAEDLRRWVARGASVYVCGSLVGMAPAVDEVIREALGNREVDQLLAAGRYRRDVY